MQTAARFPGYEPKRDAVEIAARADGERDRLVESLDGVGRVRLATVVVFSIGLFQACVLMVMVVAIIIPVVFEVGYDGAKYFRSLSSPVDCFLGHSPSLAPSPRLQFLLVSNNESAGKRCRFLRWRTVGYNSRYRLSSTKLAPSQAAYENCPEPVLRYKEASAKEVISKQCSNRL
jgi:hypothetical protein